MRGGEGEGRERGGGGGGGGDTWRRRSLTLPPVQYMCKLLHKYTVQYKCKLLHKYTAATAVIIATNSCDECARMLQLHGVDKGCK